MEIRVHVLGARDGGGIVRPCHSAFSSTRSLTFDSVLIFSVTTNIMDTAKFVSSWFFLPKVDAHCHLHISASAKHHKKHFYHSRRQKYLAVLPLKSAGKRFHSFRVKALPANACLSAFGPQRFRRRRTSADVGMRPRQVYIHAGQTPSRLIVPHPAVIRVHPSAGGRHKTRKDLLGDASSP